LKVKNDDPSTTLLNRPEKAYNDAVFKVKEEIRAQLEDNMFCAECGATLNPQDRNCTACGARVEREDPVPVPAAAPIAVRARRKSGFGVLGVTATMLRALSEGTVIRTSIAIVLQVVAVLVLLGGLLALIQILKLSFSLSSAVATVGGLVVAIFLGGAVFAVSQIYLFRAQSIRELEDSPFTVVPILSILFRTAGETYAVLALALGVGGCIFTWFSGMSPRSLLGGLGDIIPGMPAGGASFLDGVIFLVTLVIVAFLALVVFYALAELVVVTVDIAINIRRMAKRDAPASS
jgi:hypothetical protein